MFLTSNHCFLQKQFVLHQNVAFSSKKKEVVLSESGEKYAQIKHFLQAKCVDYL